MKTILLSGATEAEPREGLGWAVTEKETAPPDQETHIEQKFRKIIYDRLTKGLGASVQEQPGPNGNRWTINPGGGRHLGHGATTRSWRSQARLRLL